MLRHFFAFGRSKYFTTFYVAELEKKRQNKIKRNYKVIKKYLKNAKQDKTVQFDLWSAIINMFFKQRLLIVALYFVISVYTSFACVPPTRNSNSWYSPRRYQYSYGDSITYECEQGYVAVGGSQTITCSTYHRWSGSPLICTRK